MLWMNRKVFQYPLAVKDLVDTPSKQEEGVFQKLLQRWQPHLVDQTITTRPLLWKKLKLLSFFELI